jgi:hypothetical protein
MSLSRTESGFIGVQQDRLGSFPVCCLCVLALCLLTLRSLYEDRLNKVQMTGKTPMNSSQKFMDLQRA